MMDNFEISFPTEIYFGKGMIGNLADAVKKHGGSAVLFLYGGGSIKRNGIYDDVVNQLKKGGIEFKELGGVKPNPRITTVRKGVEICREYGLDMILAVGGGSVLDCGKAIAAGYYYEGDPWDFCLKKAEVKAALPIGTVLTLAATGSESNGNAVISNEETKRKLPIISPLLKPKFSILDPTYTFTVNRYHTAAGTADIMSHVFEQYFGTNVETYLEDRLGEAVLKTCIKYCPIALEKPDDYEARAELMWASTLGLNGLLQCGKPGDWATHKMEHELSAFYDITHGAGLAILTPVWMEYVLDESNVDKFVNISRYVWELAPVDDKFEYAKMGIRKLREFFNQIGMPARLRDVGIGEEHLEEMAEGAVSFGPIGSLRKLDKEDVLKIYKMCL